ncbi:ankyrin repeat domain-containing protein [Comamonas serinivorans]|nr:ankyrin repeat domain-containing protein [Comamonas serinivorans]
MTRFTPRSLAALALALGLSSSLAHATPADDMERAIAQDNDLSTQKMLANGVSPNTLTNKGVPVLYSAIQMESYKVAKVLAQAPGLEADQTSPKGETALMMAAFRGQVDLARQLIARGAQVNRRGWTPLHYAATNGHLAMIDFLLSQKADLNAPSPNESTPLMMAAMYGSEDAARALLKAGADPTRKNQLGMTAADFATKAERDALARTLTEAAQAWRR